MKYFVQNNFLVFNRFSNMRPHQLRIVPIGPPSATLTERQRMVDNNARRLEVLRNCVNFIFENKISDGRIVSFYIYTCMLLCYLSITM